MNNVYSVCVCKCDCGNVVEKVLNQVKNGQAKDCGRYCKYRDTSALHNDKVDRNAIVGNTYGDLTVLAFSHKDSLNKLLYVCRCKCGNITIVRKQSLIYGETRSCGCSRRKVKKDRDGVVERYSEDGERISKNNTSGVRGVSYIKSKNRWRAYMTINGKLKILGTFKDKQAAIDARKNCMMEHKSSSN